MVIHLGISYLCTRIPISFFEKDIRIFRLTRFELKNNIYVRFFKIKKWKERLPDGGSLFRKGFPKKKLKNKDPDYLHTFFLETKRAELTHWLSILPAPLFFLWNLWWVGIVMIVYALLANIPCILLQRYNRSRLVSVNKKIAPKEGTYC